MAHQRTPRDRSIVSRCQPRREAHHRRSSMIHGRIWNGSCHIWGETVWIGSSWLTADGEAIRSKRQY